MPNLFTLSPFSKYPSLYQNKNTNIRIPCNCCCFASWYNQNIKHIQKRINDLHQTQVQAYREAAVKGLREWAQSEASLEPMEDNDTEGAFVERCVTAIQSSCSWPNWRLDSAMMVVVIEIRKRARAVFAKYHPIATAVEDTSTVENTTTTAKPVMDTNPSQNNSNSNKEEAENHDTEDGEDAAEDDGEVEDGEMDDDDPDEDGQVDENEASKLGDNGTKKKNTNSKNNNKKKKVVVRKKTTNSKPGQQLGQPRKSASTNRGRRPGRGGSNAGGAKSG